MNSIEQLAAQQAQLDTASLVIASRLGNAFAQMSVGAILMVATCLALDPIVRKLVAQQGARSLLATFRIWLAVAVALVFMVTEALVFFNTTAQEEQIAERTMAKETSYLCEQIAGQQGDALMQGQDAEDNASTAQADAITFNSYVRGYSQVEDGTVLVVKDFTVVGSNDYRFLVGADLDEGLDEALFLEDPLPVVILDSLASGGMEHFVFDDSENDDGKDNYRSFCIAFLKADAVISPSDGERTPYTVVMFRTSEQVFARRGFVLLWTSVIALVLLASVFTIVSHLLKQTIICHIDETNDVLGEVTAGNLDARVEIHDSKEFESLSAGINTTVQTLKGWIAKAETRMDQELATAKTIQESALPRIFPPFPDIPHFDLYASMHAAREVGGHFYDFFLIGEESAEDAGRLGFAIADVSGKGVPAALFMMTAKTEIRNYLENGVELGEGMENVNRHLCEGNTEGMFVTVFAGILDYGRGHVQYVNAGHNPPLVRHDGEWAWLEGRSGLPLGMFEGLPYRMFERDVCVGDEILLYTDGVTEAMDASENQYGEERLMSIVQGHENGRLHPHKLIDAVRRDVAAHVGGAEQSDDITMLALEYGVAPETAVAITVPADIKQHQKVSEFIRAELERRLCPLRAQNQLDVAVEEMFVNVAQYAYPDATPENPGTVHISCAYSATPPSVTVEIVDEGIPFNPLAKPDAVLPEDIMDIPIGGLGILMAKRSVDEMEYERLDNKNVVRLVKKW